MKKNHLNPRVIILKRILVILDYLVNSCDSETFIYYELCDLKIRVELTILSHRILKRYLKSLSDYFDKISFGVDFPSDFVYCIKNLFSLLLIL